MLSRQRGYNIVPSSYQLFTGISILVQTIMRLTVLALFIALPAAAYGAVCPQQSSLEFECAPLGESCADVGCCNQLRCTYIPLFGMVCLVARFALIHVGLLSFA
jgi:hypothetical protein